MQKELLAFLNDDVKLDPSVEIVGDTDLLLTGLVDSVGVIEIVGWIEDEYGLEIDATDVVLANFQTADAMVALVERLQQSARVE